MKRIDLEGKEFPHFKVLRPIHIKYKGKNILHWECLCECGSVFHATARSIVTEKVKSCGCLLLKILLLARMVIHFMFASVSAEI